MCMKYAIFYWSEMHGYKKGEFEFDLVTEEGHLYGFENKEGDDGLMKGEIIERRFSFNKNLLYNPKNAWDDTGDIKEYSEEYPEQEYFEDAIALVLKHIGAENAEEVSIEEINSIIAKI